MKRPRRPSVPSTARAHCLAPTARSWSSSQTAPSPGGATWTAWGTAARNTATRHMAGRVFRPAVRRRSRMAALGTNSSSGWCHSTPVSGGVGARERVEGGTGSSGPGRASSGQIRPRSSMIARNARPPRSRHLPRPCRVQAAFPQRWPLTQSRGGAWPVGYKPAAARANDPRGNRTVSV